MNIKLLEIELQKLGISRRVYSLNGASDERLCIELLNDKWRIFFVERGMERTLKEFDREDSACEFMLNELRYEV